jgi:hypothetical protein
MARQVLFLVCGVALGACGGDDRPTTSGDRADLAGFIISGPGPGPIDLGGVKYDLTLPSGQQYGCSGLLGCYDICAGSSTTQSQYTSCQDGCDLKARPDATTTYQEALACGQSWCMYGSATGSGTGSYRCKIDSTQTRLVNMDGTDISDTDPGTGSKACGACLNNALADLFNSPCTSTSSADCNPVACASATNACLNDGP